LPGPNVFIREDCVGLCTEAFKDDSDDPRIHRATEVSTDCAETARCPEELHLDWVIQGDGTGRRDVPASMATFAAAAICATRLASYCALSIQ
jgi:hypothetical protein